VSELEKRLDVHESIVSRLMTPGRWTPIASHEVKEVFRLKRIIHMAYDQLIVDGPNTSFVASVLKEGL
jgi:hypothetical protein